MFTGIIEGLGKVLQVEKEGNNLHFWLESPFTAELKVDQSVSHDGVCLTVTHLDAGKYRVTAVEETLNRTNLSDWKPGTIVNLERCMPANGRFDGHIVQGHVDAKAALLNVDDRNGSWKLAFRHDPNAGMTVEKGSICINGVSLTVVDSSEDSFSVAIIPFTWEHTNLHTINPGDAVNIEFDILGKYLQKYLSVAPLGKR
ncbi:MAG: riboflavin synthase [Sphingomonadales bacterium]